MSTMELGLNKEFRIYNADGTPFHGLVLHKATVDSVVMALGDKITGDVYYKDNALAVTMHEYIEYDSVSDGVEVPVRYYLVNPPTIVREGMVSDNSDLKGMTKYSFVFYHPMYQLSNMPFTDVAVSFDEERYLSENKTFYWIGKPQDFVNKLNKNLEHTQWVVSMSENFPTDKSNVLSEVLQFDNKTIADALKVGYETWGVPYVVGQIRNGEQYYAEGKRFIVTFGTPSNEIYETQADKNNDRPFVFKFGQGVGLKNNSRTPRNNKIITRIAGYGSENNIPYGYPQIIWYGNKDWDYTLNNDPRVQTIALDDGRIVQATSYPIYDGIVGGKWVRLIKHPFTRTHLMPTVYTQSVFNKVSPYKSWEGGSTPAYNQTLSQLLHDINTRIEAEENTGIKTAYNALIDALNTAANTQGATRVNITSASGATPTYNGVVQKRANSLIDGNLVINTESIREFEFESVLIEKDYQSINTDYDPTAEIIDYYDAIPTSQYPYPNPINPQAPSYDIHAFEDIKPELNVGRSVQIVSATPLNADMTDAAAWVDDIDDDGNYKQSYFKIKLPVLSFDVYACAAITQEMQINMRSGACLGCTFTVQVNWDDYKNNFYDANGNFMPNGSQRDLTRFPDSTKGQISVIVQKDNSTFGTIMPNIYQQPKAGDEIVFLGISLPLSYITSAEQKLDEEMKGYMLENNVYYFDYPLKFDEHFLATHTNILSQIRTNTVIRFLFGDDGTPLALSVKQLTIKYGDGTLPQYDITLTDNIEVVLNQIGQVANGVERLGSLVAVLRDSINKSPIAELNKKLSRVSDDAAQGLITFNKGANFGTYVHGQFGGMGANIDNKGNMEADTLVLRESLTVPTLVFNRAEVIAGTQTQTPFGGEIEEVIPQEGDYGWARLRLEDGDVGRIRVGALCMGFFHNYGENKSETNAVADSDDRAGTISWQGFSTVYFRVIEIPEIYDDKENTDKAWFRYKLREEENGGNGVHPFVHMTFGGRGYVRQEGDEYDDIKQYQAFTIRTPFYTARLVDVGSWEWEIQNYTYINGMLDGFGAIVNQPSLKGFGTIDMSVWIKGHITQVENTPDYITIEQSGLGFISQEETQTVWVRVLDGYRNNHTTAYSYEVYRGTTKLTKGITIENEEARFVINYSDMNAELVEFTVVATSLADSQNVLRQTFEVRKTIDPNVVIPDRYELKLSDANVHIDKDKNLTPSDVKIRVVCVHGDGTREYMNGIYLRAHVFYAWVDNGQFAATYNYFGGRYNYHLLSNVLDSEGSDIHAATVSVVKILLAAGEIADYEATGGYDGTIKLLDSNGNAIDVIDSKTIPFVSDGQDGAAGLVADFDDEMISIPVDSTGVAGSWSWTTRANLWLGMEKLPLSSNIVVLNDSGLRHTTPTVVNNTDATITINGFTTTDIENKKLQLRLTSSDGTYVGVCTAYVNKIPAGVGGDGRDAVIYQLSLDATTVKKTTDGSVTPNYIKIKIAKTAGTETTYHAYNAFVNESGSSQLKIYTRNDAQITTPSQGTLLNRDGVYTDFASNYIHVAMFDGNGNLVDAETVPILKDGEKGQDGSDGVTIVSTSVTYAVTGGSNQPNDSYFTHTAIPSVPAGYYLWTKTEIQYSDGTITKTYSVSKVGANGTSVTISSTTETYALTTSSTQPTSFPYSTRPDVPKGYYLWTKTVITFSDGTSVTTYAFSYNAKDGEDSAAYDFTRFSNDARLVNGVWNGTFTDADQSQVIAEISEQGGARNLVRNGDFNNKVETTNSYNPYGTIVVPIGWTANGSSQSSTSYVHYGTQVDDNGVTWMYWRNRSTVSYDGICQINSASTPEYLMPLTAGVTYTLRLKYKTENIYITTSQPSRIYCVIHFLTAAGQNATSEARGALDITESGTYDLVFDFTVPTGKNTRYGRVIVFQDSSKLPRYQNSYDNLVSQIMVQEKASATEEFFPAPEDEYRGTIGGLWRGTLHWKHSYASTVFSDYDWAKVRDAEPRMTTWDNVSAYEHPDYNEGDTSTEQITFFSGAYGERYYDMVYDGTDYWLCKKTYIYYTRINGSFITPNNTSLWTMYWEKASQYNFLMAKTLFAARAYIEQLTVQKLSTNATNGSSISIRDGVMEVYNTNGLLNIQFGVDGDGMAVLRYIDNNGNVLYNLGPEGLSYSTSRAPSFNVIDFYYLGASIDNVFSIPNFRYLFSTYVPKNESRQNAKYFLCKINAGVKVRDGLYLTDTGNPNPEDYDQHYFTESSILPFNTKGTYLSNGYYFKPTDASLDSGSSTLKRSGMYGTATEDYAKYSTKYNSVGYGVSVPSSINEMISNPLIYAEVYHITNGKCTEKINIYIRYNIYKNDPNIAK